MSKVGKGALMPAFYQTHCYTYTVHLGVTVKVL